MKYLLSSVIAVLLIGLFAFKNKEVQTVNDQYAEFKNIEVGRYTAYITNKDGDKYTGGIEDFIYEVVGTEKDKNYTQYDVILMKIKADKKSGNYHFMAQNPPSPATLVSGHYIGNPDFQERIGYSPDYNEGTRVVFLDGRIYLIEKWKNKDDYQLTHVLEKGEYPGGLKGMKLVFKSPKKMADLNPHKLLQDYLDIAIPQQEKAYSTWKSKSENSAILNRLKQLPEAWDAYVKSSNKAYWDSPEGRSYSC